MTTDIDRIIDCLVTLNECWARTIEVAIGISLLALRMGWVCLMPLIIVIRGSQLLRITLPVADDLHSI